jgi:hypothetical protein
VLESCSGCLNPLEQFELGDVLAFQNIFIISNSQATFTSIVAGRYLLTYLMVNFSGAKWCSSVYATILEAVLFVVPMGILADYGSHVLIRKGLSPVMLLVPCLMLLRVPAKGP